MKWERCPYIAASLQLSSVGVYRKCGRSGCILGGTGSSTLQTKALPAVARRTGARTQVSSVPSRSGVLIMFVRTTLMKALALGLIGPAVCIAAQAQTSAPAENAAATAPAAQSPAAQGTPTPAKPVTPTAPAKGKNAKATYTGPNTIVVLPPTPMLDGEGKQRVDPDGKPVFATATNLGYDEKGKKIAVKKVKPPKMMPVSIGAGTLTVDGWTGKARLNYDIADLKYMYIYAPGIGIAIVSQNQFPGAKEQSGAFNDKTLRITVDGHPIELASEKRLLGKKPQSAWVAGDRGFQLPS